jgi:DNA-binding GntR family transcriptional regulator
VSQTPPIAPPPGARATVRLERVSTSEALVKALTRQILDGTVPAGTWLREVELAERHGVSRQSLRAALVELVHLGLLQREPHRGVWVPVMTDDDVRDLYYVRSLIEIEAARVVAARPQAWPALDEVVRRLERLSEGSSGHEMVDADFEFHRVLVSGVGSSRLSRSHEMLCSEIRLSFVSTVREDGPTYLFGEHRALLDVLQRGDPDAAAARIAEHLAAGLEVTLAGLASAPPRAFADDDGHAPG